jgi:Carboxypeptidase regulatory-like domain
MPRLNAAHIFIRSGVVLGSLILGAVYTLAQTSSITGKVTDSFGSVIPGTEIKAMISSSDRASASQAFRAISNNNGEFTIPSLPFGSYEVEVKAPGFKTLKEKVIVAGSQPTRIDLQITPPKVCEDAKGPNIELAEKDKAEIINQVLKMEFQNWQVVREPILLSTQNIKAAWVSAPPGHTITVLSTWEITSKARPGGYVDYYYFSEFEVHEDCVAITLLQDGVTSEGESCNLCGGGSTYVFRKEAGDWKGKFFSGWIS